MFRFLAFGLTLILLVGAATLVWTWRWLDTPPAVSAGERVLTIARGASTKSISNSLADAELLEHPSLWAGCARVLELSQAFRAGEYKFAGNESPRQLMLKLVEGEVTSYALSLVEGWTLQQALAAIEAAPKLEWDLAGADSESLFRLLASRLDEDRYQRLATNKTFVGAGPSVEAPGAEGWLFPDTYSYSAGSKASDLAARAWQQMQAKLAQTWQTKAPDLPYANPAELLTMASIVEKETGQAADRDIIAQVFVRRLNIGMRLQTDPTVIYGLGSAFDGNLKRIHLRTDTAYNSYTRHGLPPTAIALPGMAALMAAANPAEGEYLYFVARGDGSSQFSKNLVDHEAAVQRYQRRAKSRR